MTEKMSTMVNNLGGILAEQHGRTIANFFSQGFVAPALPQVQPIAQPILPEPMSRPDATESSNNSERVRVPRIPSVRTWEDCIRQFKDGDPARDLPMALMDWTKAMRQADPSRYSQRKLIADEFFRLNQSKENMEHVHGEELKTVKRLLTSIRRVHREKKALRGMQVDQDIGVHEDDEDEEEEEEEEEEDEEEEDEEEEDEEEEELVPARKRRRN